MSDITLDIKDPQPVNSASTSVELAHELKELNQTIKSLQIQIAQQNNGRIAPKEDPKEKETNRNTSRTAVTITFGIIAAKIGALIGTKIGLIKHFWTDDSLKGALDVQAAGTTEKEIKNIYTGMNKMMKTTGIWAAVGAGIGAIAGVIIGWKRGDRIEKPGDLLTHPLDSLGKIFGAAQKHPKEEPAQNEPVSVQWQNTIASQESQRSELLNR